MTRLLLIGANEKRNRGEANNLRALSKLLASLPQRPEMILTYKLRQNATAEEVMANQAIAQTGQLVTTMDEYETILPFYTPEITGDALDQLNPDQLLILGIGESTLDAVLAMQARAEKHGHVVQAGWMSDAADEDQQYRAEYHGLTAFLPAWVKQRIREDNPDSGLPIAAISGIPNGNTEQSLRDDLDTYLTHHPIGKTFKERILDEQRPYAIVVGNAGSTHPQTGVHTAVDPQECHANGYALGKSFLQQTDLLHADGGPRSLADDRYWKKLHGSHVQLAREAFIEGYLKAQHEHGFDPQAYMSIYDPEGVKANPVNAAIVLSHDELCQAVVISVDGQGTKFDAVHFGLLGKIFYFPSTAFSKDDSNAYYAERGITALIPDEDGIVDLSPLYTVPLSADREDPFMVILRQYRLLPMTPSSPAPQTS